MGRSTSRYQVFFGFEVWTTACLTLLGANQRDETIDILRSIVFGFEHRM